MLALGAPPDRITTPTWSTSNSQRANAWNKWLSVYSPNGPNLGSLGSPSEIPWCCPKKAMMKLFNPSAAHYAVLRLTSQGSLCMVPFKWLDLLKRGPTNHHWGCSRTAIKCMTTQPGKANDCRVWFQAPKPKLRHFAAKPTETCLLWRGPLNPFQVAPWPRTDGWLIDLTDLIDAHPALLAWRSKILHTATARPPAAALKAQPSKLLKEPFPRGFAKGTWSSGKWQVVPTREFTYPKFSQMFPKTFFSGNIFFLISGEC